LSCERTSNNNNNPWEGIEDLGRGKEDSGCPLAPQPAVNRETSFNIFSCGHFRGLFTSSWKHTLMIND